LSSQVFLHGMSWDRRLPGLAVARGWLRIGSVGEC
jgi:hypothetical protein